MTRDGGVILLGQVDRKRGLMDVAAHCIADPISPLRIKHGMRDILRQRVYGLALGLENLNDHATLGRGPADDHGRGPRGHPPVHPPVSP